MSLAQLNQIIERSDLILKGKKDRTKLVICNILAQGHTLLEDAPGVGKTTLVKYLAQSLSLKVSRIQFTNDLLPADIIGAPIFSKDDQRFHFHPGPIFGELILADELNRAPPKTQSALLQVMEERVITVDGEDHTLPEFFTVIATQNPHMQVGTFDLPESQLDRFSMKLQMGYPDKTSTLELLKLSTEAKEISKLPALLSTEELSSLQIAVENVKVEDSLYDLVYQALNWTRTHKDLIPLSNRCGIDLIRVAKAWAFLETRDYMIPDDLFYIFPFVAGHRLVHPENSDIEFEHKLAQDILGSL
jgi:MoxR-like ATPase